MASYKKTAKKHTVTRIALLLVSHSVFKHTNKNKPKKIYSRGLFFYSLSVADCLSLLARAFVATAGAWEEEEEEDPSHLTLLIFAAVGNPPLIRKGVLT